MIGLLVSLLLLSALGYGAFVGYRTGRYTVPTGQVGIVRRVFGPSHPDRRFKRVIPSRARGLQARTLTPGRLYWFPPLLYRIELVARTDVPSGMIGVVTALEGAKRSPRRTVARHVECDDFQDGEAFLLNGGEQGRQLEVLAGDTSYYINTALFEVEFVPRTHVPAGTVGLVIAKDGEVRPLDQPFGRHVECDNFQDGQAFLRNGGQQGRQLAVLPGGTSYDINTALFEVITTRTVDPRAHGGLTARHLKEIAIPIGDVGVVVTLDGAASEPGEDPVRPPVAGHRSFRLPWVFLANGGRLGVQEETLGEGTYALNPWFVRVVLIPTRLVILEWTKKDSSKAGNFDAALDQIVVNIQGYRLQVEMSQTLQIPGASAPRLVSRFGDTMMSGLGGLADDPVPVQRFVERVLGSTVATYFNAMAAAATVDEFLTTYASTRTNLAAQVRNALLAWEVEAVSTNLGEFESQDPELDRARQRIFAAQMRGKELTEEEKSEMIRSRILEIQHASKRQERLLDAALLEEQIRLLGADTIAMQMFLRELKDMGVPEFVSGDAGALLEHLPMQRALEMIGGVRQRARQSLPPAEGTSERERA